MDKVKKIPATQVSVYVIENAIFSLEWLKKLEDEWQKKLSNHEDGYTVRKQQTIIKDVFTGYIASLVDTTKKVHSLKKSYKNNIFIQNFIGHPIVKKSVDHRNKRFAHQSTNYGSVVSLEEVLSSNLLEILKNLLFVVRQFEEKN